MNDYGTRLLALLPQHLILRPLIHRHSHQQPAQPAQPAQPEQTPAQPPSNSQPSTEKDQ